MLWIGKNEVRGIWYKYMLLLHQEVFLSHHTTTSSSNNQQDSHHHFQTKQSQPISNLTKPPTTNMKTFAAIAAFAGLASADYFSLMALRSASPIHFEMVSARDARLYLGGNTGSSCPAESIGAENCPAGNVTSFASNGNGGLDMGAEVPGGQQVYITPCGEVGYTIPHSAQVPEGAIVDGWTFSGSENGLSYVSWKNGLVACPTEEANGIYQVFAAVEGKEFGDECLGFDAVETDGTQQPTAWEYTY